MVLLTVFCILLIPFETPDPISAFDVSGKDTITTDSGLKYIIVQEGEGVTPYASQFVSVHYTGYLTDGNIFDSSIDRGEPIAFPVGVGRVIPGWDEGLLFCSEGEI